MFENEPNLPEALRASRRRLAARVAGATVETRIRMTDLVLETLDARPAGALAPPALV